MEKLHIDIGTLRDLQREGYLDGYKLTDQGRRQIRVVACGGVFDILHPGHGFFLQKSKEYGDVLVVIVARDETVERRKRIPIVPEEQRLEMVRLLKPVDIAVLGGRGDFLKIIEKIRPDVIVLGPDQTHDEDYIRSELERRGLKVEVKRIEEYKECALHSTRSILQKIIETEFPDQRKSP
jgi:FAD synthetase